MKKIFYYDGPIQDSGLSQEERDKLVEEYEKKNAELKDWPPIE